MKKLHKGAIVLSATLVCGTLCSTPWIVKATNQRNVVSPVSETPFKENLQNFTSLIKTVSPNNIEASSLPIKPYDPTPFDATNECYKNIFASIDKKVIENDLYIFLKRTKAFEKNFIFKFYIKDIDVVEKINNGITTYNIQINFELQNDFYRINKFKISNGIDSTKEINFEANEIKSCSINIDSSVFPYLYKQNLNDSTCVLKCSYYFKNALWTIGNTKINFKKFFLNLVSPTLNTSIINVDNGVGYLDIKDMAYDALNNMNANDFKNDIVQDFDLYLERTLKCIGPTQKIIQNIINNETIIQSLKNISSSVNELIENVLSFTSPELKGLGSILEYVLTNPTLFELLNNSEVIEQLIDIVRIKDPTIAGFIEQAVNVIPLNSKESFDSYFDLMLESDVLNFLTPEQIKQIATLKDEGIITFIFKNKELAILLLDTLNESKPNKDYETASLLLKAIPDINPDTNTILELIVWLIKAKDENGESITARFLDETIQNKTIKGILNKFLWSNNNLTQQSLANTLDALANPKDEFGNVIDYAEYINTIKISKEELTPCSYQKDTRQLNFKYKVKYQLTKTIRFDIYKILGTNGAQGIIPINPSIMSILSSLKSITCFNNDSFDITYAFHDCVDYVVEQNNQDSYNLSWQALAVKTIDMNMPQTVKEVYSQSRLVWDMFNSLCFATFDQSTIYQPISSTKLNKILINNYNPNKKNGSKLLTKTKTPEELKVINDQLNNSITYTQDTKSNNPNDKFLIAKGLLGRDVYAYRYKTSYSIDLKQITDELYDTSELNINFKVFLSCNHIRVPILGKQRIASLTLTTPCNIYSNNALMTNTWTQAIGTKLK